MNRHILKAKSVIKMILMVLPQLSYSQADIKDELLKSSYIKANWISLIDTDTISQSGDSLYLTRFLYGTYKFRGYAIWENKENAINLLWSQLDSSDFPPHTFSYVDFNDDKKMDLRLLAGEDEEFFTRVYINQTKKTYSLNNFVLKYSNDNVYSTILDIDNDGTIEILDSKNNSDLNESPNIFLTPNQEKELSKVYYSMSRENAIYNFSYGVPGSYKFYNMFLMDSIRIHQYIKGRFIDNTRTFSDHLSWRIKFLTQLKNDPRNDSKYINNLIKYLKTKQN